MRQQGTRLCANGEHAYAPIRNSLVRRQCTRLSANKEHVCALTMDTRVRQQGHFCAPRIERLCASKVLSCAPSGCAPTTGTVARRQSTHLCASKEHSCAPTVNTLATLVGLARHHLESICPETVQAVQPVPSRYALGH